MAPALEVPDVKNKLEDLSGIVLKPGENPYNALIEACNDDPAQIQQLYHVHRTRRNAQQREKVLAADFEELIIDPYLLRLENPTVEPGFKDPRYSMVLWARPPIHILKLAGLIQQKLQACAPSVWLMPTFSMHMTTLEFAHSRTAEQIDSLKNDITPAIPALTSYAYQHRTRLVKPMVSHDLAAFALSFLPASGERVISPPVTEPDTAEVLKQGDGYSYHHLRRDTWDISKNAGVDIDSRYVVPSAHITLGRFLTNEDHATPEQRQKWIDTIDAINKWLETSVWDNDDFPGEWMVGQEHGLDLRVGALWYGGGRTVLRGPGF